MHLNIFPPKSECNCLRSIQNEILQSDTKQKWKTNSFTQKLSNSNGVSFILFVWIYSSKHSLVRGSKTMCGLF